MRIKEESKKEAIELIDSVLAEDNNSNNDAAMESKSNEDEDGNEKHQQRYTKSDSATTYISSTNGI